MSLDLLRRFAAMGRRLRGERGGNILAIVAGAMVPMTLSVGFGVDYARAMRLQSQMNAAADAAALAAVTAPMMQSNSTSAQDAAKAAAAAMFNGQVARLTQVTYDASKDLAVDVSLTGSLNNGRKVAVRWRAQSINIFGSILGAKTLAISGSASSQAVKAPYINFYLMLDVSPSMLLPTTSAGLSAVRSATTTPSLTYGCAYACHTQNPHSDSVYVRDTNGRDVFLFANYYNLGQSGFHGYVTANTATGAVYNSAGTLLTGYSVSNGAIYSGTGKAKTQLAGYWADGYWLTHNYGTAYPGQASVETRIDAERLAAQQVIPYAASQAAGNGVTYKLQLFAFDWTHSGSTSPVKTLTSSMTDVSKLSASSVPDLYAAQDYWYANNQPVSGTSTNDKATEAHTMLTTMNSLMATPGDGTSAASAQEVMFLITDGVADETINGARWNREFTTTHLADCTAIKNRGIKIAILYTQYLPDSLTGDSWSQSAVAPYLGNVAPALKSCASSGTDGTPLFFQVTTDQNISDALVTLFALTVQQAHLVQ